MTNQPAKCPACGKELEPPASGAADMPTLPNPNRGEPGNLAPENLVPRNWAENNLRRHIELLDQISVQLDQLKISVEAGSALKPAGFGGAGSLARQPQTPSWALHRRSLRPLPGA